jgi:adenosylcobinamide amidohydrolase
VRLAAPHETLSWAVVGGGRRTATAVAWWQVRNAELGADVDPAALLRARLAERGLGDAVGLLTSADVGDFVDVERAMDGLRVRCVATVGLGNALRAGDPPWRARPVGTINVLVRTSFPLSEEARVEALALAAEARTLAVREGGVLSVESGLPASGTGTDCIVVASPAGAPGERYAGKHTVAGHLVGAAVADAVALGVARWSAANRP